MTLQGRQQDVHQRPKTLAADPIRRLPQHNQRLADRIIVDTPSALSQRIGGRICLAIQYPDRRLPMVSANCNEFGQNPTLLIPVADFLALTQCRNQSAPHLCRDDLDHVGTL